MQSVSNQVMQAVTQLQQGQLIAYPTEAVFGIGCDPENTGALQALLALKQRPSSKGLILVAADIQQLQAYIDIDALTDAQLTRIESTWPGPVTWIVPVKAGISRLLRGQFESIAVRVSAHPVVQELCQTFGHPITSTSANLSGLPPCRTASEVKQQLNQGIGYCIAAPLGTSERPTQIRDARTGQILRF